MSERLGDRNLGLGVDREGFIVSCEDFFEDVCWVGLGIVGMHS